MSAYQFSSTPSYSQDEWNRLSRLPDCMMMPVVFDDLLAPNLPVDAMHILRHFWFGTWGRVRRNPWMPPDQIAERLPQWALDNATASHAYAVYRDLVLVHFNGPNALLRSPDTLKQGEPSYRSKRRLWTKAWVSAESRAAEGRLSDRADDLAAALRAGEFYPDLMQVTATQQELCDLFGPRSIGDLGRWGRTRASIRSTLRWMEEVGLIVARRCEPWSPSVYEFGTEMWHVLTTGDFSAAFRARFRITSPPSEPFFRVEGRGCTPRADGFDRVRVRLGAYYRVPRSVESLLARYMPQTAMPVVWYVIRNTLGRNTEDHSSVGYTAIANKEMARRFGPASVAQPAKRGRRVKTVREAIDWCVEYGILDRKRYGDWTELSLGPELWPLLREGVVSQSLSALLGAQSERTEPTLTDDDLSHLERLTASGTLSFRDMARIYNRMSRWAS